MKKYILVTSTDLMMVQFLIPHVINLKNNGYVLDVACSDVGGRIETVRNKLDGIVSNIYEVNLKRNPYNIHNINGYFELNRIIGSHRYDIIWTNEPVMSVMTRLAAADSRKNGTKVIYMVHGFHFYGGAPLRNWFLYYPIERAVAKITDEIVTINQEDYSRAKRMNAKSVRYIHGIGVDVKRSPMSRNGRNIREELGISPDDFIILSVGELMPRKNQQVILRAMGRLKDNKIHYILCGSGKQQRELERLIHKFNISSRVHFLGYRYDVMNIYKQADIFVFPSKREGLGLAALEAMYSGLPLITSNTSGPRDYMENGKTGYMCDPDDYEAFAKAIKILKENKPLRKSCGEYNKKVVVPFCIDKVKQEILEIFEKLE